MSPTIFKESGLRFFFFFSREEERPHVHVQSPNGEAKIWVEPRVRVARNHGLRPRELSRALSMVDGREHFLSFGAFPWFQDATIAQLAEIERAAPDHLRWPALDVDLSVESIAHPERYPLVSGVGAEVRESPDEGRVKD